MITQKTINVKNQDYTVNVCDLSSAWILIHNGVKALTCNENGPKSGSAKLETINTIFEAATKDECKAEAIRLNLTGFDDLFSADSVVSRSGKHLQVNKAEEQAKFNKLKTAALAKVSAKKLSAKKK
jgi:hypothetical protein